MYISQVDLAHDVEIEICGRFVTFARSLENLKRVEGAVGAAAPFGLRLDARGATHAEITRVYSALLSGAVDAPSARDLDAWVFAAGGRHAKLAHFCYSLALSSDELDAVVTARNLAAGRNPSGEAAEERAPFAATGARTGPSFSALDTVSGSLRERLMLRPSTN